MTEKNDTERIEVLALDQIRISELNPRKEFDSEKIAELLLDILEKDQLQDILVRPVSGMNAPYEIVVGERRYRAHMAGNLPTIRARIKVLTDREALEAMLSENIQREDLKPLEEARAILNLVNMGLKQTEVAEKLHKSKAWVSERLALLYSPEDIQEAITSGLVAPSTTKLIKGIEKSTDALAQISEIIKQRISKNEPTDNNAMKSIIEESYEAAQNCYVDDDELYNQFLEEHASGLPNMFRAEKQKGEDPDEINVTKEFETLCRNFITKHSNNGVWPRCEKCKSNKTIRDQWGNEASKCLNDECFISLKNQFITKIWNAVPDFVTKVQKKHDEKLKLAETGAVDLHEISYSKWTGMEKGGKFPQCKDCPELKTAIPGEIKWKYACMNPDCIRKLEKRATRDATIEANNEKNIYRETIVKPLVEKIVNDPDLVKALLTYHLLGYDNDWRTVAKDILKFTQGEVEDEKPYASSSKNTIIKLIKNKGNDGALRFAISRFILGYSTVNYFDPIDRAKNTMKEFEEIATAWEENTTAPTQEESPEGSQPEPPQKLRGRVKGKTTKEERRRKAAPLLKAMAGFTLEGKVFEYLEHFPPDHAGLLMAEVRKDELSKRYQVVVKDRDIGWVIYIDRSVDKNAPLQEQLKVEKVTPSKPRKKEWSHRIEGAHVEGNSIVDKNNKTLAHRFQDTISKNWYAPVMIFEGTSEGHAVANAAKRELSKELGFCRVMKRAARFVIYKREGQSKEPKAQEQLEVDETPEETPKTAEQGA